MSAGGDLSLLILTEDSGEAGYSTILALTREMLHLVDPDARLDSIDFEPIDNEEARRALRGNAWTGEKLDAHYNSTALARSIATKLLEDDGLVLFHIDGDQRWSDRKDSTNLKKFRKSFEVRIRQLLTDKLGNRKAIEARMSRLVILTPFYSIESWLYQNTEAAIRLCRKHHRGKDVDRFAAWRADRRKLDEEIKPKDQVCFKDRYNRELAASGFPAAEVHAAGKSFKHAVEALRKCAYLVAGLARLRRPPRRT